MASIGLAAVQHALLRVCLSVSVQFCHVFQQPFIILLIRKSQEKSILKIVFEAILDSLPFSIEYNWGSLLLNLEVVNQECGDFKKEPKN